MVLPVLAARIKRKGDAREKTSPEQQREERLEQTSSEQQGENLLEQTSAEQQGEDPLGQTMPQQGTEDSLDETFLTFKKLDIRQAELRKARTKGARAFIEVVLTGTRKYMEDKVNPEYRPSLMANMLTIYAICPPKILESHMNLNWLKKMHEDADFAGFVRMWREHALHHKIPVIYRVTVGFEDGSSYTKRQVLATLDLMQSYVRGEPSAIRKIDGDVSDGAFGQPFIKEAGRVKRQNTVLAFINNTRQRMETFEKDSDIIPPFFYVGITIHPVQRMGAHLSHSNSSNYVMTTFALAVAAVVGAGCVKHWHPLWLCFKPGHTQAGEMLFDLMASGHAGYGAGFAITPPGTVVREADYVKPGLYHATCEYVFHTADADANMKAAFEGDQLMQRLLRKQRYILQSRKMRDVAQSFLQEGGAIDSPDIATMADDLIEGHTREELAQVADPNSQYTTQHEAVYSDPRDEDYQD